jgi:uncharacterized membrane protein
MTLHLIIVAALYVLGLAFVGILGYRIALAMARHMSERRGHWSRRHAASQGLAALAERYARGEISAEEYAERKSVLEK